jgi:hypothetical protein
MVDDEKEKNDMNHRPSVLRTSTKEFTGQVE